MNALYEGANISGKEMERSLFILISVTNRNISIKTFKTIDEAKEEMKIRFFDTDGVEECLEAGAAFLGETSAWCNADGGDMQCDWEIVEIPKAYTK